MRAYPEVVAVAVGAVIIKEGRILLVKRGHEPGRGRWGFPGGMVEVGESLSAAVVREVREECGVTVRPGKLAAVVERVDRDSAGRVRYHWVILDFHAELLCGEPVAASDATEARWVELAKVTGQRLTPPLERLWRLVREHGWERGPFWIGP